MVKTIAQINETIQKGDAVIVRADEIAELVAQEGLEKTAEKVDVVTSATFGAMCSSGVFLNFGHTDPPLKMGSIFINDVEAYGGLAAVDAYLGATQLSHELGMDYGGGHVIEDLLDGKEVSLKATGYGTDCYPRKNVETSFTLDDVNQATLYNPRNCYQSYNAATNSTSGTLHTYMGILLPNFRNINFCGAGELNPMKNDPTYRTIGFGTKIFLGGGVGYIAGEGTQHSPTNGFGTLSLSGDLKQMSSSFIKGSSLTGYGTSLMVGVGVAIPILDTEILKATTIQNKDIPVNIFDYGVPRLSRPMVASSNYEELFTGEIELNGKPVKAAGLTSMRKTYEILDELDNWISAGEFELTLPVEQLSTTRVFKPLNMKSKVPLVKDVMVKSVISADVSQSLEEVSGILIEHDIDQVPVLDGKQLVGIITSLDITRAMAEKTSEVKDVMTKNVITSKADETLDEASRRIDKKDINSTPVVSQDGEVIGILTSGDIARVYGRLNR